MTTEQKIVALARECGFRTGSIDLQNGLGTQTFIESIGETCTVELEAFYHKAQAEAFEAVAVACDSIARGWKNNPGNAPMAGYIASSNCAAVSREMASSNCAAVSREMAKEMAKEMK